MDGRSEFARPVALGLTAIAAVGWLVAVYFWAQAVGLRADADETQRRSEMARSELVGELQTLQQSVGAAADLRKQLDEGRKALDDAVAQRTTAQSELADLTRRVDETELSLASESDQLDSKTALLKDVVANVSAAQNDLADLATQKAAIAGELEKEQLALAEAQARARAADASAVAAKTAETDASVRADELGKTVDAAQARLDILLARLKGASAK